MIRTLLVLSLILVCAGGCREEILPPPDPYTPILALVGEKAYAEAIRLLEAELPAREHEWRVHHYLGICHEKMGRRNRAVEHYMRAVVLADNYRPCYRLGVLYIETGEAGKALPLLRRVKAYNPDFINGRFYLAVAAFFNNKIDESLANFRFILAREEISPGSLANIGLIKYYQGNPFQAVEFLLRSIEYAPEWAWGHFQLGAIYMKMGRLDAAARQFELALRYDPENSNAKYHMALTLEGRNRKAEAAELFDALLETAHENDSDLGIIKASILIKRGDLTRARDILVNALRDARQPFEIYKRLGYLHSVTGDHRKGIACYREALKHFPDDIGVRYNYAVLLKNTGEDAEAEKEFDEILAIDPITSEGYFLQGIIYGRKGDLERAEQLIKTAIELDRFNNLGRQILLDLLIRNNKLVEAAAIAEEILALNPDNTQIKALLAQVFVKMGNLGRAEDLLFEIIDWDAPGVEDIENFKTLHNIYRLTNRTREAEDLESRMKQLGIDPFAEQVIIY